jgi:hypothetical protein
MSSRICNHVMSDGTGCQAFPLRDQEFCYFHFRYYQTHRIYDNPNCLLPVLEDPRSIILGLHQTIAYHMQGRIDAKTCGLTLYALQIASSLMSRAEARSPLEQKRIEAAQAEARAAKNQSTAAKNPAPQQPETSGDPSPSNDHEITTSPDHEITTPPDHEIDCSPDESAPHLPQVYDGPPVDVYQWEGESITDNRQPITDNRLPITDNQLETGN